jgi:hypothetical protein
MDNRAIPSTGPYTLDLTGVHTTSPRWMRDITDALDAAGQPYVVETSHDGWWIHPPADGDYIAFCKALLVLNNRRETLISGQYQQMVREDQIKWHKPPLTALPKFISSLVSFYLECNGIEWEMGTVVLGDSHIIKVHTEKIQYIEAWEGTCDFMWWGPNHDEPTIQDWDAVWMYFMAQ